MYFHVAEIKGLAVILPC